MRDVPGFDTKKKTLLVVDDNELNRMILEKILCQDYQIEQAENGQVAYDFLEEGKSSVDGILLDVVMPVMGGFEFLQKISQNEKYKHIPVVVTTGNGEREVERKSLELGAWDFISKPYDKKIVQYRVKNVIARSQMEAFAKLKYLAEYDELTGIYNKAKFFENTRLMINANPDRQYIFLRADIARFKLVNSYFGMHEGDLLLQYIADFLREFAQGLEMVTYGRIVADVFGLCIAYTSIDIVERYLEVATERLKSYKLNFDIVPTYGIYLIDELDTTVNTMYDRATLAAESIKGSYLQNVAYYDTKMEDSIKREQEVTNEMGNALLDEQFVVYIQPKYSLETDSPCGGEALVRWIHPEKGLISPGVFIPVFEKNGFVSQLDYYMWDKVCALLGKWIEEGKNPYPVSVNVSRVNIYNSRLVEILCGITEKYHVPNRLLQLELTESAYTDNIELISKTIDRLRQHGFTILMDDFGSGYSSLNVLKDVIVDILKIDMRFFDDTGDSGRSESIIASVIRMAKWLNIPVVAEGVEKKQQVEFLRSIGCEYIQGFYFAKPMPAAEYEQLIFQDHSFEEKEVKPFDAGSVWSSNPEMEKHFVEAVQAMAIYECDDGDIEILRVNRAYYNLFGGYSAIVKETDALRAVEPPYRATVGRTFANCVESKTEATCEYMCRKKGTKENEEKWVRMDLHYVTDVGGQHILYGSLSDVTETKKENEG